MVDLERLFQPDGESLTTGGEIVGGPEQDNQPALLFDLADPEDRAALNEGLVLKEVDFGGQGVELLFWTTTDETGRVEAVPITQVKDVFDEQLERLFLVENPQFLFAFKRGEEEALAALKTYKERATGDRGASEHGLVVVYLDRGCLIRTIGPEMNRRLRTASNRGLISEEEQERLRSFTVCCLGLSVGNLAMRTWQKEADPQEIRGGDPDFLEQSNLNRLFAGWPDLGDNKAKLAIEQALEHNPFVRADLSPDGLALAETESGRDQVADFISDQFPEGVDDLSEEEAAEALKKIGRIVAREENFGAMFTKVGKVGAVVEVMDDLRMKILARLAARELGVPVLMVSDTGDVILDIERYDQEPKRPIFQGLVNARNLLQVIAEPNPESFAAVAGAIVGPEYMPPDFAQALRGIGEQLVSPPQLASTITCAAGIITKRLREIALGEEIGSRRELYDFRNFRFEIVDTSDI